MVSLCWRNWFRFVLLVFPFAYIQLNAEMTNGNWNTGQCILEENNMKFKRKKKIVFNTKQGSICRYVGGKLNKKYLSVFAKNFFLTKAFMFMSFLMEAMSTIFAQFVSKQYWGKLNKICNKKKILCHSPGYEQADNIIDVFHFPVSRV